ncbi:multidrug efflux SMR transporter [Vogesella sp. LIG4]|uniref:DMT family transporter n=1 Tax=Vogesella sp. LIG4 TaxID=1192162 RepID=UPI00081FDE24|nr:multidrug efflux SMR transporter [Vogesella sp. LIG4]SCK28321.1 small multidrug resistance pump [Vogesella sp. LIG4]
MNNYLMLAIAIVAEVVATSSLKASSGFTRLLPSVLVVLGYVTSFYLLPQIMKSLPVGVVYAIWCGVGIVAVALVGQFLYKQVLDGPAYLGIGLIVSGVVVLQVFSRTSGH